MSKPLTALSPMLLLLVGALVRLATPSAVEAGDPCYHGFDIPQRTAADTTEVTLGACWFGPTETRVPTGSTVSFVNGSDFTHLVTGANQEWGDRDAELLPGARVTYTFTKPGIYPYACALHRGMSGVIVVGDASAAARVQVAGATPPATDAGPGTVLEPESGAWAIAAFVAGGSLSGAVALLAGAAAARRRRSAEPD